MDEGPGLTEEKRLTREGGRGGGERSHIRDKGGEREGIDWVMYYQPTVVKKDGQGREDTINCCLLPFPH